MLKIGRLSELSEVQHFDFSGVAINLAKQQDLTGLRGRQEPAGQKNSLHGSGVVAKVNFPRLVHFAGDNNVRLLKLLNIRFSSGSLKLTEEALGR